MEKGLLRPKRNGAENTNRELRRIASLAVWSFGGAQFSSFLDGNSLQDDGTEAKPAAYLSARKAYLQRKRRYL